MGRTLVSLSRDAARGPVPGDASPDVTISTNLGGFINGRRLRSRRTSPSWATIPLLRWTEGPSGQHIELGICEMNLFLLLGQLGLAWDLYGQPLLPIGTVYDPFVCRGLDAFIYALYSGARLHRRRHARRGHARPRRRRAPVDHHAVHRS